MQTSPFQITARAISTEFAAGKPIRFEIEVKNVSKEAAQLLFSSGQKFDFKATPLSATDGAWSHGTNRRFAQALSTQTLDAGQALRFETIWNGAQSGIYEIDALIRANGGLQAPLFQIVVE